jgi:hypothetical protein
MRPIPWYLNKVRKGFLNKRSTCKIWSNTYFNISSIISRRTRNSIRKYYTVAYKSVVCNETVTEKINTGQTSQVTVPFLNSSFDID